MVMMAGGEKGEGKGGVSSPEICEEITLFTW